MNKLTAHSKTALGPVVEAGAILTSFRGETATLVQPTRPTEYGRSGKVLVEWTGDGSNHAGARGEYYASVFDLVVTAAHGFGPDNGRNIRCLCGTETSTPDGLRRHIAAQ